MGSLMPYGLPKSKDTLENNTKMEHCVADLERKGHSKSSAVAICKSSIAGKRKRKRR